MLIQPNEMQSYDENANYRNNGYHRKYRNNAFNFSKNEMAYPTMRTYEPN